MAKTQIVRKNAYTRVSEAKHFKRQPHSMVKHT